MYKFSISPLPTGILFLFLIKGLGTQAQAIADPAGLPKNSFQWTQEERELGFLNMDEVFPYRKVPKGKKIHPLPEGAPLNAYQKGGTKEKELEEFLQHQFVSGLLVVQDGKIRLERYALGLSDTGKWTSQSVAKSVTSTLVGAAIKDGYINSVEDKVTDYISDLKGSAYENVSIHQLLTMTTGIRWSENHTDPDADLTKFFRVPIEPGVDEAVNYMRQLPSEAAPGTKWVYKTGETHLLGVLVTAATGKPLATYLSEKIWKPYGMEQDATWILGRTNQELAGCCLQMNLRDFARFGQLVLDSGQINGESIVPKGWFQTATRMHVRIWGNLGYGYQWWTYDDGTFRALGVHGQMIHIDPSRSLVVVVTSVWPEAESTARQMAVSKFIGSLVKEIDKPVTDSHH